LRGIMFVLNIGILKNDLPFIVAELSLS